MDFRNKKVWITGASSGIGEALAYDLSRRGATLILSSRREEVLEKVRADCARPEEHAVVTLDLADPPSLRAAADRVHAEVGPVDVLVNNGGVTQRSTARETSMEAVRRVMEINFFGTVALTQAVLPQMLGRGRGTIVVVSSLVGKFGTPMRSTYSASKHALHGYFDSLRAETHDDGIRVTIVCPGYVRTNILAGAITADGSTLDNPDAHQKGIPPEDCAARIAEAVEQGRDEVYVGGYETLGVYVKRLSPALFNRIIRNMKQ